MLAYCGLVWYCRHRSASCSCRLPPLLISVCVDSRVLPGLFFLLHVTQLYIAWHAMVTTECEGRPMRWFLKRPGDMSRNPSHVLTLTRVWGPGCPYYQWTWNATERVQPWPCSTAGHQRIPLHIIVHLRRHKHSLFAHIPEVVQTFLPHIFTSGIFWDWRCSAVRIS